MRIPEVREEMDKLVEQLEEMSGVVENALHRMKFLRNELIRRKAVRVAPVTSTPMSGQLAQQIRSYAKANPKASQKLISTIFNVNSGRVSEALRGKRT